MSHLAVAGRQETKGEEEEKKRLWKIEFAAKHSTREKILYEFLSASSKDYGGTATYYPESGRMKSVCMCTSVVCAEVEEVNRLSRYNCTDKSAQYCAIISPTGQ